MSRLGYLFLFFPLLASAQQHTDSTINEILDKWHVSAAQGDADTFFNTMAEDAIYIGTDKTERWDKKSFYGFAKKYFDRGRAWDFKPYDRQIIVSEDGNIAWFSELLETWMGVCRGSGILAKNENNEWKLKQYHLSVTVPNDLIQNFIKLVDDFEQANEGNK